MNPLTYASVKSTLRLGCTVTVRCKTCWQNVDLSRGQVLALADGIRGQPPCTCPLMKPTTVTFLEVTRLNEKEAQSVDSAAAAENPIASIYALMRGTNLTYMEARELLQHRALTDLLQHRALTDRLDRLGSAVGAPMLWAYLCTDERLAVTDDRPLSHHHMQDPFPIGPSQEALDGQMVASSTLRALIRADRNAFVQSEIRKLYELSGSVLSIDKENSDRKHSLPMGHRLLTSYFEPLLSQHVNSPAGRYVLVITTEHARQLSADQIFMQHKSTSTILARVTGAYFASVGRLDLFIDPLPVPLVPDQVFAVGSSFPWEQRLIGGASPPVRQSPKWPVVRYSREHPVVEVDEEMATWKADESFRMELTSGGKATALRILLKPTHIHCQRVFTYQK